MAQSSFTRVMRNVSLVLAATFLMLSAEPAPVHAELDTNEVAARNQITSGDYSTNVIAQGSSVIYIFLDEDNKEIRVNREEIVKIIRSDDGQLLQDTANRFPGINEDKFEQLAIAEYVFSQGQYSLSASLYREVLGDMDLEDTGYNAIEGMVTASFYGSARHYEGLRFICDQYQYRPSWSFRFRHAIHAHVRALVAHFDHEKAEQVLTAIRRDPRCHRLDFTNAWIPIHLSDMRALERSAPFWEHRYGISNPDDILYAEKVLHEGGQGFEDYLLFIMGRFEELIDGYPDSYLYDLALLGVGWRGDFEDAVDALETYLERFHDRRGVALALLLERANERGGDALVSFYASRYPDDSIDGSYLPSFKIPFSVSSTVRVWVRERGFKSLTEAQASVVDSYYKSCQRFEGWFERGQLAKLEAELKEYLSLYQEYFPFDLRMEGYYSISGEPSENLYGKCMVDFSPTMMDRVLDVVRSGATAERTLDDQRLAEIGVSFKVCGDARDGFDEVEPWCRNIIESLTIRVETVSLHLASARILRQAFDIGGRFDSKSLFLSGLAYRRLGDYKPFVDAMELYVDLFPNGRFADDALAEIGWFYLVVRDDVDSAEKYFERVIEDYSRSNAFDNALNWMVISKRSSGDLLAALSLSAKLLATVTSQRLLPSIVERHDELRYLLSVSGADSEIVFREEQRTSKGFAIEEGSWVVVAKSSVPELPVGARLLSIDGREFSDAYSFFRVIEEIKGSGLRHVEVEYGFPRKRKVFSAYVPLEIFFEK